MNNREAIASLKTLCNTCTMFPKCVNNKPECFQAIETAISALEKQEEDRWHSVAKEGNPKESGHYFVVDKSPIDGNEPHARYFNLRGDTSFWSGWKADEVVAWKKITSEPYTEEES